MARNSKKDDNYPVVAPFLLPDDRLVLLDVDKSIYVCGDKYYRH